MFIDKEKENSRGVPFDRKPILTFKEELAYWTDGQLAEFIAGCHKDKDYSFEFDMACRERNNRL